MTKKVSYQHMQAELEQVLASLQSDDIDIDQATAAYQRGMELVRDIQAYLKETENTITKIQASFDKAA